MAATIPPWLNINPIEPARILQRSQVQRAQNAAAERRAQLEAQRMQMQEQMMYARLAAQERADQRKEQVLHQTRDSQLAQQAAALEFRREMGMRQNAGQMQQLRIRQQQEERKTASAARQLLGMNKLQEDIGNGMPLEQALAKNSSELFSDHPERLASAMRAARPPKEAAELGPEAYRARPIIDEQGQPIGQMAIPGKGAARVLGGRATLSPGETISAIKAELGVIQPGIIFATTPEEKATLTKRRDELIEDLRKVRKGGTVPLKMQPEGATAEERLPGKEDERTDTGEEGEGDFGLPPVDMGEDEEMSDEFADEEPEPEPVADEEDTELEEDF
jgi:hypothetical protein